MPVATFAVVGAFTADGAYVYNKPISANPGGGVNVSRVGVSGPAIWGPLGTPVHTSGKDQLLDTWGDEIPGARSMVGECKRALESTTDFVNTRVDDTTSTAMQMDLLDTATTPVAVLHLYGIYTGSRANGAIVRLDKAPGWTITTPVYNLSAKMPDATQETWQGIVGYKTTNGTSAYDAATFQANAIAAVNVGSLSRTKSKYFIAGVGTSTIAPATGINFTTVTPGTDGAAGVTDAMCIGTDSSSVGSRRGMYALNGTGVAAFALAGVTDLTTGPTQATFAQSQLSFAVGPAFQSGTDTPTAITQKQSNNINSIYQLPVLDWVTTYDPTTGKTLLVSPLGTMLGIIAAQPPGSSPSNKPERGLTSITGTERGGAPLGGEAGDRAQAGIGYIGPLPRDAGLLGMPHGQNASGVTQTDIAYTLLTNYLMRSIPIICGRYVGANQSEIDPDPTRVACKADLDTFLESLKDQSIIAAYSTQLDLGNNAPLTIEQGYMLIGVYVKYFSTIRFILATLQAGSTIQIKSATAKAA